MDFRKNEALRGVRATIRNNGSVVDLTGKAVAGKFRLNRGIINTTDTVTIESPQTAGIVHFDWRSTDLIEIGNGELWFEFTQGGHVGFSDVLWFSVSA